MADLKEKLKKPEAQAAVLLGTLLLFIIANSVLRDGPLSFIPPLIAAIIVVEIVAFVAMEVKDGAKRHGWTHEVVDTIIALGVAVAIWFGLSVVLNTGSPISGVVSCSMLPNLQRGDFVIVQGVPIKAYDINMSQAQLDSLNDPARISYAGGNTTIPGSIFSYCLANTQSGMCQAFIQDPTTFTEQKGAFTYRYSSCPIAFSGGSTQAEPCLTSVSFGGNEYMTNFSNDVVVYQPNPADYFAQVGDIVHRVMFRINVDGKYYYLTRGDNNPILDLQVYDYSSDLGNHPIPQERLRGTVIGRIPYLGYFKLFLSGYFKEDPQCKTQLTFPHAT